MINIQKFRKGFPKNVFISGGMSGIGLELAKSFAEAGADVAIFDLQDDSTTLESIQAACLTSDQQVKAYALDLRDNDEVERTIKKAVDDIGQPNLALNSAGILRTATFEDLD